MLKVICQHYLSLKQREDAKSVSENFSVLVGAFIVTIYCHFLAFI